jgi:hypothetical protein
MKYCSSKIRAHSAIHVQRNHWVQDVERFKEVTVPCEALYFGHIVHYLLLNHLIRDIMHVKAVLLLAFLRQRFL